MFLTTIILSINKESYMKNYIYSDLALESSYAMRGGISEAPEYSEKAKGDLRLCKLDISDDALSKKYGRDIGTYMTVFCPKVWLMTEEQAQNAAESIGEELRNMLKKATKKDMSKDFTALVVGLGNSDITPDSIGPRTVARLTVTRHVKDISPSIFNDIGQCSVAAISPGVLGQTGIETLDVIKGTVKSIKPDAVIAVDALASRSCERLATTVQISDNGINPGSGIGNLREGINKQSLGVPVIALGVPTVVDSSTLVYDALERAEISDISDKLKNVLDNGRGFFVSPKESDVIATSVSNLLAEAINASLRV